MQADGPVELEIAGPGGAAFGDERQVGLLEDLDAVVEVVGDVEAICDWVNGDPPGVVELAVASSKGAVLGDEREVFSEELLDAIVVRVSEVHVGAVNGGLSGVDCLRRRARREVAVPEGEGTLEEPL